MGGEKRYYINSLPDWRGSPPRGRGKEAPRRSASCPARITPAWAGKRPKGYAIKLPRPDHPRVGGEKYMKDCYGFNGWGSPPRGRGKEGVCFFDTLPVGITPAWAGKSARRNKLIH